MLSKGFLGTYDATADDKGRVRLPAKFRAQLGDSFVLSQGTGNYLCVYPEETWDKLTQEVTSFSTLDTDVSDLRRSIFSNAVFGEFDAQGRVLVPQRTRGYANLKKDLVVIGNFDFFEIWDRETWESRDYSSAQARMEYQQKVVGKNAIKENP